MDVCIINGNPRKEKSNSRIIIDYMSSMLEGNNIKVHGIFNTGISLEKIKKDIDKCHALILVFPLYVDSIPSQMLEFMMELEKRGVINKNIVVYCAVNNGFYEGAQNRIAIEQVRNWSRKIQVQWGQGIGIGSGEILPHLKKVPLGSGPLRNLGKVLEKFTENIKLTRKGEDIYINPNYPRFLWKIQASLSWIFKARKNKVKIWEILKKI